jgi:hypothetical protein
MRRTRYRTTASGETEIRFPLLECWNPLTKVATIAAQVDDRRVLCRISIEVLQERFRASATEPMLAVRENRPAIEAAAKKRIEIAAYEQDGSIVIRDRDI